MYNVAPARDAQKFGVAASWQAPNVALRIKLRVHACRHLPTAGTHSLTTLSFVACDLARLLVLVSRSRRALAAEHFFLRKELALFQERKVKPHCAHDSTRLVMVILGQMFSWRDALVNVKPDTFLR